MIVIGLHTCISVNGSSRMLFDFVAGCSLLDEMTSLTRFGPFSSLLLFRFRRRPYGKGSKFRIGGAGPLDICSLTLGALATDFRGSPIGSISLS